MAEGAIEQIGVDLVVRVQDFLKNIDTAVDSAKTKMGAIAKAGDDIGTKVKAGGDVAAKGVAGVGDAAETTGGKLGEVAEKGGLLAKALGGIIGGAIGAGLGLLGQRTQELNANMAQLAATAGLTQEQTDKLKDSVIELSKSHLQSQTDIVGSMEALITMQGVEADNLDILKRLTNQYLDYSLVTGQTATAAVHSFAEIIKAWNLTASDALVIMDALILSHQKFGINVIESQDTLATLAPTFKILGLSVSDAIAYLNLFKEAGIDAGSTTTAFSKAVGLLTDGTAQSGKKLAQMTAEMGFTAAQTNAFFAASPAQKFQILSDAIGKIEDPAKRAQAAIDLFGAKAGPKLAETLKLGNLDQYRISVTEAAGASEAAADKIESTLTNKLKLLANQVLGTIQQQIQSVSAGFEVLGMVGPKVGGAMGAMGGVLLSLGPVGLIVGAAVAAIVAGLILLGIKGGFLSDTVLPALKKAFGFVADTAKDLYDTAGELFKLFEFGFSGGQIYGEWSTLEHIAFGFGQTMRNDVIPAVKDVGKALLDVGAWIIDNVVPQLLDLGKILSKIGEDYIKQQLLPALITLKQGWEELLPILKDVGGWLNDHIVPILKDVGQFLLDHKPLLIALAAAIVLLVNPWMAVVAAVVLVLAKWDEIKTLFTVTIPGAINSVISKIQELPIIGVIFTDTFNTVKAIVTLVFNDVKVIIETAINVIKDVIHIALALISGDWSEAWNGIKQLVTDIWDGIQGLIEDRLEFIKSIISTKLELVKGIFSDAWDLIKGGVAEAWDTIKATITDAAQGVLDFLSSHWPEIATIIAGPFAPLVALATDAFGVRSALEGAFTAAYNAIQNTIGDVISFLYEVPGRMVSALSGAASMLWDVGVDMIRGLIGGIKSMAQAAADAAVNVVKGAWEAAKSFLKVGSPSKLFQEMGQQTLQGYIDGLKDKEAELQRELGIINEQIASGIGDTTLLEANRAKLLTMLRDTIAQAAAASAQLSTVLVPTLRDVDVAIQALIKDNGQWGEALSKITNDVPDATSALALLSLGYGNAAQAVNEYVAGLISYDEMIQKVGVDIGATATGPVAAMTKATQGLTTATSFAISGQLTAVTALELAKAGHQAAAEAVLKYVAGLLTLDQAEQIIMADLSQQLQGTTAVTSATWTAVDALAALKAGQDALALAIEHWIAGNPTALDALAALQAGNIALANAILAVVAGLQQIPAAAAAAVSAIAAVPMGTNPYTGAPAPASQPGTVVTPATSADQKIYGPTFVGFDANGNPVYGANPGGNGPYINPYTGKVIVPYVKPASLIPSMGSGGVLFGDQVVHAGEVPEAIIPLDRLPDIVNNLISPQPLKGLAGAAPGGTTLNLTINAQSNEPEEIGRVVERVFERHFNEAGHYGVET